MSFWAPPSSLVCLRVPLLLAALLVSLVSASTASAASAGSGWAIQSVALPSNFSAHDTQICEEEMLEDCDSYLVTAMNVGSRASEGTVVLTDQLPGGVEFKNILH